MEKPKPVICVFCGSSPGKNPGYMAAAKELGRLIAERGFTFLYGGGGFGLMGEAARAAQEGGAKVIGVMPDFLRQYELPPQWEKDLILTPDLAQRKTQMMQMADAFAILPGGPGTMDEFFEVITSASLGVLRGPIVVINTCGYFDPLARLMDHMVREGFAGGGSSLLSTYSFVATPEEAIEAIAKALGW